MQDERWCTVTLIVGTFNIIEFQECTLKMLETHNDCIIFHTIIEYT